MEDEWRGFVLRLRSAEKWAKLEGGSGSRKEVPPVWNTEGCNTAEGEKKMLQFVQNPMYTAVFAAVAGIAGILALFLFRRRKNRTRHLIVDEMEGHEFERFCAELLRDRGFLEVELTGESRDYGVDILAEKDGVTYAVQCKCYASPVGVGAVQEAYAGRDYYDRMVGVVLTNQYFTAPAADMAKKLKILLWDRGYLEEWLEEQP